MKTRPKLLSLSSGLALTILTMIALFAGRASTSTSPTTRPGHPPASRTLRAGVVGPPSPAARLPASAPASRPSSPPARPWWSSAVVYEIFVRSFKDSNGDGVGDLRGIISKLDYLAAAGKHARTGLGINALWLTPIFASPSYHGYDVTDYRKINPVFGSAADLDLLVREARRRGIRIVLDLVVNHTSARHPWFRSSARSVGSPHRRWYIWRKSNPGWTQPWGSGQVWHPSGGAWYFGIFWRGMPDLNILHPPVRRALSGIARHWLQKGVAGFRLDAARHLVETGPGKGMSDTPGTHAFWRELRAGLKRTHPNALLLGEIWSRSEDVSSYCKGDEMDLAVGFETAEAIKKTVASMTAGPLRKAIGRVNRHYRRPECNAPFLANHDMTRFATQLKNDQGMLRVAAALLLALPGTPILYYGEELGMRNGPGRRDEDKRRPMQWRPGPRAGFTTGKPWIAPVGGKGINVQDQVGRPGSLLRWYGKLIRARRSSPTLSRGLIRLLPVKGLDADSTLAFERRLGNQRVVCLHNVGDEPVQAIVHAVSLRKGWWSRKLLSHGKVRLSAVAGALKVELGPGGLVWLKP